MMRSASLSHHETKKISTIYPLQTKGGGLGLSESLLVSTNASKVAQKPHIPKIRGRQQRASSKPCTSQGQSRQDGCILYLTVKTYRSSPTTKKVNDHYQIIYQNVKKMQGQCYCRAASTSAPCHTLGSIGAIHSTLLELLMWRRPATSHIHVWRRIGDIMLFIHLLHPYASLVD